MHCAIAVCSVLVGWVGCLVCWWESTAIACGHASARSFDACLARPCMLNRNKYQYISNDCLLYVQNKFMTFFCAATRKTHWGFISCFFVVVVFLGRLPLFASAICTHHVLTYSLLDRIFFRVQQIDIDMAKHNRPQQHWFETCFDFGFLFYISLMPNNNNMRHDHICLYGSEVDRTNEYPVPISV